jgi:hypothetical protein
MVERAFVHIGLPKTGTSYLQTILWASRDQLEADGVVLPGEERRDHLWASRVVREDPKVPGLSQRKRTAWDRVVAELAGSDGTGLISHEFFSSATQEQAARMVERLAPAEVHVVVTARNALDLFTASWQVSLKNKGTTPMADYSRRVSQRPTEIWNWRALDLRLVLERWAPAVPAERVHVLPVDTSAPREALWRTFCDVVGLPADHYDTDLSFPNVSMGVAEAETLRRVNQHLVGFGKSFDRGVWIRTFLADERLVPRRGEPYWPLPDQVEECRERAQQAADFVVRRGFDVRGDPSLLLVPDTLPPRRTPDTVTEAEVAEVAVELVATLLGDVRREHGRARRRAARAPDPARRLTSLWRQRGWPTSLKKRRNARS